MFGIALKLALYDRVKFFITIAGVAFAVTLVLVQVSLLTGILANATATIENTRADLWVASRNTANIDFGHPFPEAYAQRIASTPGVARADNLIVFYSSIALPNGAQETLLTYGIRDGAAWGLPWDVLEGDVADLHGGRTMFLDDSATRRFGPFAVGDYREVGGTRLRIVGRTRGATSFTTVPIAFFDISLLQRLQPDMLGDRTTFVLVRLAPGSDAQTVAADLRRRLPYNDVYTAREWAARTRDYWMTSTGLGMNMFVTVFLGCLVGIVVVAQTLYAATIDHLKEFGTLKAVGASNGEIYQIIAWQAVVAAAGGYAVGLGVALGTRAILARVAGLNLMLTPRFAATVAAGTLALCALASLVSYRKISSIDPALVFRG